MRFDIIRRLPSCVNGPTFRPDWLDETWGTRQKAKAAGRKVRRYKGNGKSANVEIGGPGKEKRPNDLGSGAEMIHLL